MQPSRSLSACSTSGPACARRPRRRAEGSTGRARRRAGRPRARRRAAGARRRGSRRCAATSSSSGSRTGAGEGDDRRPEAQRRAEHERRGRSSGRTARRPGRPTARRRRRRRGRRRSLLGRRGRLPCVRRTPLGRPPVPLENGTAARSSGCRSGSAYGSPCAERQQRLDRRRAVGLAAEDRERRRRAGRRSASAARTIGAKGAKAIASRGTALASTRARLVSRPQRAQRRDGGARAPDAQRHHRPPRQVGHRDGDEVAGAHAAARAGRRRGRPSARPARRASASRPWRRRRRRRRAGSAAAWRSDGVGHRRLDRPARAAGCDGRAR